MITPSLFGAAFLMPRAHEGHYTRFVEAWADQVITERPFWSWKEHTNVCFSPTEWSEVKRDMHVDVTNVLANIGSPEIGEGALGAYDAMAVISPFPSMTAVVSEGLKSFDAEQDLSISIQIDLGKFYSHFLQGLLAVEFDEVLKSIKTKGSEEQSIKPSRRNIFGQGPLIPKPLPIAPLKRGMHGGFGWLIDTPHDPANLPDDSAGISIRTRSPYASDRAIETVHLNIAGGDIWVSDNFTFYAADIGENVSAFVERIEGAFELLRAYIVFGGDSGGAKGLPLDPFVGPFDLPSGRPW